MAATVNYERRREKAQYFIEPMGESVGLEMTLIPAGTFMMGSPEDELQHSSSEGPQHKVTVPRCFMGTYPVTQAQWQFVEGLPLVETTLQFNRCTFKGDNLPVEQVNWYEAVEFCVRLSRFVENRLSNHTGREYRLPSEAEWEYACRANTKTPFHFGDTITTDLANYRGTDNESVRWSGSYGNGPKGEYRERTTPVDHFKIANDFGLCDMHGNVWEWCQDVWHSNYEEAPTDGSAWLEGGNQQLRVLRSGSWVANPRACRSAFRHNDYPGYRNGDVGFRVVCSAPQ